jgi:hypothetical protein
LFDISDISDDCDEDEDDCLRKFLAINDPRDDFMSDCCKKDLITNFSCIERSRGDALGMKDMRDSVDLSDSVTSELLLMRAFRCLVRICPI